MELVVIRNFTTECLTPELNSGTFDSERIVLTTDLCIKNIVLILFYHTNKVGLRMKSEQKLVKQKFGGVRILFSFWD